MSDVERSIPLAEILEARERSVAEWKRELDRETPDSFAWGALNAMAHLREALDRRDLAAVKMWVGVMRRCKEAERRAVFREGDDSWRRPSPEARR